MQHSEQNPSSVGVPMPTGIERLVCIEISRRQHFGLNKYGTTVADNPLDLRAWLQHALEECLDQAVYLRRAIAKIDEEAAARLRAQEDARIAEQRRNITMP